jgi:hypothetical protein
MRLPVATTQAVVGEAAAGGEPSRLLLTSSYPKREGRLRD